MELPRWIVAVAIVLLAAPAGLAQEAPALPEPTAEHEALGIFVGEWAGSGELKPGPFGPGGPMEWTETCSWFADGGFHVVCRSEGSGPMGEMTGLGIMGYDPEAEVYTHYAIDSSGWTGRAEGTLDGDVWTYRSEETIEGETFRTRMTMTVESPTRLSFTWAMSEDGESWTELMSGSTEKQ